MPDFSVILKNILFHDKLRKTAGIEWILPPAKKLDVLVFKKCSRKLDVLALEQ
jgi:hypothetical protein